jgi:adenylate cyclase
MIKDNNSFLLSFWTIRLKMMSIITLILILSFTAIIFIATYFFKNDTEQRIDQSNSNNSSIIGLKIKTDIETTLDKIFILAKANEQEFKNPTSKAKFIEEFFKEDPHFILFGIYTLETSGLTPKFQNINQNFLKENDLTETQLKKVLQTNQEDLKLAFSGESVLHNASLGFPLPIIALAIPYKNINGVKTILLTIFRLEKIISAFKNRSGLGEAITYMVNGRGIVLAHPDTKVVLSATNLSDSPIIKAMLTSKVDNGQIKHYEETNQAGKLFIGSFKQIGFAGAGVVSSADESIAFAAVYQIQRFNTWILFIALFSSILIVFIFANTLTKPILNLVEGTKQIEKGDFKLSLRPSANDEVGLLTNSFVKMGKGLEEREKVKDALGRFVNKEVAEMVLKGELKLGGERKNCAIFFSDIRSFTAISEKLEPEEVVEFLNAYMTEMVKCVNLTNGTVDKFIGDAVMATWGAAFSRGNDAENAVNGALMMRKVLLKFNEGRGGDKKPIIKIGSGLNYGPVVAGQIGSTDKMEYTVIGDAVNLASRIESLNKPFGTDILISSDLYEQVKDIFLVEKMKSIKVKGKEEPQIIYAVLGRKDDPESPTSLAEVRKIVGIQYEEPKESSESEEEKEVKYEILE